MLSFQALQSVTKPNIRFSFTEKSKRAAASTGNVKTESYSKAATPVNNNHEYKIITNSGGYLSSSSGGAGNKSSRSSGGYKSNNRPKTSGGYKSSSSNYGHRKYSYMSASWT